MPMRRIIMFALICLIGVCHLMANPVTVSQAREKASEFLNKRVAKRARAKAPSAKSLKMMSAGKNDSYYIFNVGEEGGYVVVSGDDATEEILGYSDTGSIDPETMPCNMRALLDIYAEQIKYIRDNGITREQNLAANTKSSKSFHLSGTLARFGQGAPYNLQCPEIDGKNCVTGCVATAMAQLMFYHSWPDKTTSTIPGYVSKNTDAKSGTTYEFQIDEIPGGTAIDWGHILPEYVSDASEESKNAVAHLMKLAGASVKMEYGTSSSTPTAFVAFALKQYFGYASAEVRLSSSYNYYKWVNMLRQELENNGPIVYAGDTHDQGTNYDDSHAFLLEGYEDDYFDMNFGWSGLENGRFLLDAIVLEDGITHFGENQYAIMNVVRQSLLSPNDVLHLRTDELKTKGKDIYLRSTELGSFEGISLWEQLSNCTTIDTGFILGFEFTNENGEVVDNYYSNYICNLKGGESKSDNVIFSGNNLVDGKYTIQAISKEVNSDTWQLNDNSDEEYINAVVCGDKLSLQYTEPVATVSLVDIIQTSEAPLRVGQQSDFIVTVKNAYSSENYKGGILIKDAESDKVIHIDEVDLVGDGQGQITFSYTPTTDGEHHLQVLNKSWDEIGGLNTFAYAADASLDLLEVTGLELVDGDMDRLLIDGTYLRARMSVKNNDIVTKKSDITIELKNVETQTKKTKTVAVNIEPNSTATASFGFGNLTAGDHYIITAYYPNGVDFYTSPQLLCTTEGMGEVEPGNESLVQYEYWFDDDFANRQVVGMNSSSAVVRASIETDGLEYGAHRFNFRVKRSDNMYSAVTSSMFLKKPAAQNSKMEYWFDDNFDGRDEVDISSAEDEQTFELDLRDNEKYPWGFHKLNMRIILEGGGESAVYSSGVLKLSAGKATTLEYWLDGDRSNVHTISGSLASDGKDYLFVSDLDLGDVTPGHHRLYCRAVSNSGKTASAVTMTPIIVKSRYNVSSAEAETLTVTEHAYWFDNEEPEVLPVDNPKNIITQPYTFDTRRLSDGQHTLHVQYGNSAGIWNGPVDYTFTKTRVNDPLIAANVSVEDGVVTVNYTAVPYGFQYVLVRKYPSGTIRKADVNKSTDYPAALKLTDKPAPGTYTYYIDGKYTDANGEIQEVRSGEMSVTVEQPANTDEKGIITAYLLRNGQRITLNNCRSEVYVNDERIYDSMLTGGFFQIWNVPYGTELNIRVEDPNWHYDEMTLIVSENLCNKPLYLNGTAKEDVEEPESDAHDLTMIGEAHVTSEAIELEVLNNSKKPWSGNVIVKIINKADRDFYDMAMSDEGLSLWYYLFHPEAGLQDIPLYKTAANMHVYLDGKKSKALTMDIIDLPEYNKYEDYYVYVYSLKDDSEQAKELGGKTFPRVVTFNPFECFLAEDRNFKDYVDEYKKILTHLKMMSKWGDPFGLSINTIGGNNFEKILDNLGNHTVDLDGFEKDLLYYASQSSGMLLSCFLSDIHKVVKNSAKHLTNSLKVSDGIVKVYETLNAFYGANQVDDNHKFFETSKQVLRLCETLNLDDYLALNVYKNYFEVGSAMASAVEELSNRMSGFYLWDRLATGNGIYKIKVRRYSDGNHWNGYFPGRDFYPDEGYRNSHYGEIKSMEIELVNPLNPSIRTTSTSYDVEVEDDGIVVKNVNFSNEKDFYSDCEAWLKIIWKNNRVTHVPLLDSNFVKLENLDKDVSTPLIMTVELQSETYLKENIANKITFVKQK